MLELEFPEGVVQAVIQGPMAFEYFSETSSCCVCGSRDLGFMACTRMYGFKFAELVTFYRLCNSSDCLGTLRATFVIGCEESGIPLVIE